jgi:hypothetical protein
VTPSTIGPAQDSHDGPPALVTPHLAQAWVEKARRLSLPLLDLAGDVADPATVVPQRAERDGDRLYGNFMLAWLDHSQNPRVVHHLPDASFFLKLLNLAYAPIFKRRPELHKLLSGTSRPEMAITNDVLQIQLATGDGYSMIRHHALMLFHAALWLDEPERAQWLDLYDEAVTVVDQRTTGRPDLDQLAITEAGAFADFQELAPRSLRAQDAHEVLSNRDALCRILDYQLYAAVAIGLLWREYRALPVGSQTAWHRQQLSSGYVQEDFLNDLWTHA